MATVRFSNELQRTIKRNARGMFDDRLKAIEDSAPQWGDEFHDMMFGSNVALMEALPNKFFRTADRVVVQGICAEEKCRDMRSEVPNITVTYSEHKRIPYETNNLGNSAGLLVASYSGVTLDRDDSRWTALLPAYDKFYNAYVTALDERDEFVTSVGKVICAYSTLGPALKAWPPLWDLLPMHTKDRHKEIVERKKKDPAAKIGVDLNSMTAQITAKKLTGGIGQ